jgi:ribosomal protein S18 acetylase RimI-like enzyme
MEKHQFCENYRDNEALRAAFFDFSEIIFSGIDFRLWFAKGYWRNSYIPFSIIENGRIVSNVSITKMNILLNGQPVRGIQIGTVGTIPEYCGQGLSRLLMERVLKKYNDRTDLFFLFANESVVDFYPKFGFRNIKEAVFKAKNRNLELNYSARKLDIGLDKNFKIITNLVENRRTITRHFGAENYGFITMWHVLNIFPRNLFFLDDDSILFIITEDGDILHVWDIIYTEPFDISTAIPKIIQNDKIKSIHYHLPPDQVPFSYDEVELNNDSLLFVRGSFTIKDDYFKFPTTAQT